MRFYLPFCLLILLCLSACQSEDRSVSPSTIAGKWQLTRLMHGWTRELISAQELPYQIYYEFRSDSTFQKYQSNGSATAGTYSLRQKGQYWEVVLTFLPETTVENQALQFSCEPEFILKLTPQEEVIEDNLICDGPRFYFRKVEENK